eukprot:gene5144-7164_t
MSIIGKFISSLYPMSPHEYRGLMVGLDASGRTTALYRLKLGEVVTTIPTIGFNVETLDYKTVQFTLWDVGGCDKIRPLWRHYYQNTQVMIYFVDSNDRDRFLSARDELARLLNEDELRDVILLVFANKQDLPNCMTAEEVSVGLELDKHRNSHRIHVQGSCAISGEGLYEGIEWLYSMLENKSLMDKKESQVVVAKVESERSKEELLLEEWLERVDEEDELFLQKLTDATLDQWDHRTHLRIAWLYLTLYGRREGLSKIFTSIKSFIERSPRTQRKDAATRGTTFHETMTYFWVHMVHYAMNATKNPNNQFKTFLLLNPQLSNGGLFLHYYSKQRMLMDAEARVSVLLPDIRPLPSLITALPDTSQVLPVHIRLQPKAPLTDEEFIDHFETNRLTGWGHDSKLRLIYITLQLASNTNGRGNGADSILEIIESIEKEGFHLSLTYFWIHMIRLNIAIMNKEDSNSSKLIDEKDVTSSDPPLPPPSSAMSDTTNMPPSTPPPVVRYSFKPFNDFLRRPLCQSLRNSLLYEKYYSRSLVDSSLSAKQFTLPDLKPLPNKI